MPNYWSAKLYFTDADGEGWSEGLFAVADDAATVTSALTLLAQARVQFLSNTCRIVDGRVSQIGPPRDVRVAGIPANGMPGQIASPLADATEVALGWRFRSTTGAVRSLATAGLPQSVVQGGKITTFGNYTVQVTAALWLSRAIAVPFGIKSNNPAELEIDIITISQLVVNTSIIVTFAEDPGFETNDLILIKGVKSNKLVNGTWRVQRITPTNYQLKGSRNYSLNETTVTATATLVDPVVNTMASGFFERPTKKKLGVVFGAPRGKRPKRVVKTY